MKAGIYARISTFERDQEGKGQEAENQLAELRRFATSQGWEIQREYVDHESGKKPGRAAFQELFADAACRRFDVVLFWALDRFTREGALETLQYLNRLTSYGVGYRSFTEPYLDSCGLFKEAIIAILGTVAKQERVRISERVRAGLKRAKERGRQLGRRRRVFDRLEVIRLRDEERLSWRQIASRMGVGVGTAVRAYQTLKDGPEAFQKRTEGTL